MKLSERIIKIRKDNNLTQDDLAALLFVTRQAVSKREREDSYPSLDTLRLISSKFNISMNELLDVKRSEGSKEYKSIGFKDKSFMLLYIILFILVGSALIAFNILLIGTDTNIWISIFYNALLGVILLEILYLLFGSIFPIANVLVEYNDFGIKVTNLKGEIVIPFNKIESFEVKTHGKWDAGRLLIKTSEKIISVYPLKDLNKVKTVLDEIRFLNK